MQELMEIFQEYGLDRFVGIGLAIAGVLLLTMGYRLFRVLVNLMGFVISGGVFAAFMYYMFQPETKMLAVVFLLSGIIGAFFAGYMYKAGVFIMCGVMGGYILFWLTKDTVLMLAGGLLVAIIAVLLERIILILLTSLAGSFLLASLAEIHTDYHDIIVLGAAIIVAVAGMLLQFLTTRSKKKGAEEEGVVQETIVEETEQEVVTFEAAAEETELEVAAVLEPEIMETQDVVEEEISTEEK